MSGGVSESHSLTPPEKQNKKNDARKGYHEHGKNANTSELSLVDGVLYAPTSWIASQHLPEKHWMRELAEDFAHKVVSSDDQNDQEGHSEDTQPAKPKRVRNASSTRLNERIQSLESTLAWIHGLCEGTLDNREAIKSLIAKHLPHLQS